MKKVMFSSDNTEWETPDDLFSLLNGEFRFTLDPCASHLNAKCLRYYTKEVDGLKQNWVKETPITIFMNPPYKRRIIDLWMEKAYRESRKMKGVTVVCLVPARTDTDWWWSYALKADEIRFLKGRVKFKPPPGSKKKCGAPYPSAIVIFRLSSVYVPTISWWDWREKKKTK